MALLGLLLSLGLVPGFRVGLVGK